MGFVCVWGDHFSFLQLVKGTPCLPTLAPFHEIPAAWNSRGLFFATLILTYQKSA